MNDSSNDYTVTQDSSPFTNDGSQTLTDGKEVVITLTAGATGAIELSTTATLSYKASIDASAVTANATVNNIAAITVTQPSTGIAANGKALTDGSVAVKLLSAAAASNVDKLIVSYTVNGVAQDDVTIDCLESQDQNISGDELVWTTDAEKLTNVTTDGVKIVITNIQFQKKSTIALDNAASSGSLENIVSAVKISTTAEGAAITSGGNALNLIAGKEYTLTVTAGSTVGDANVKVVLKYDTTKTVELGTIPANTAANTELTFTFTAPADLAATATIEKAS